MNSFSVIPVVDPGVRSGRNGSSSLSRAVRALESDSDSDDESFTALRRQASAEALRYIRISAMNPL